MPYLQLDVNDTFPAERKQRLAKALCATYVELMKVDIRRICIAVRECGDGGVWRTVDGELERVSVLMCDIRRGRLARTAHGARAAPDHRLRRGAGVARGSPQRRVHAARGRRDVPPDAGVATAPSGPGKRGSTVRGSRDDSRRPAAIRPQCAWPACSPCAGIASFAIASWLFAP